jgi:hypothetical protein
VRAAENLGRRGVEIRSASSAYNRIVLGLGGAARAHVDARKERRAFRRLHRAEQELLAGSARLKAAENDLGLKECAAELIGTN